MPEEAAAQAAPDAGGAGGSEERYINDVMADNAEFDQQAGSQPFDPAEQASALLQVSLSLSLSLSLSVCVCVRARACISLCQCCVYLGTEQSEKSAAAAWQWGLHVRGEQAQGCTVEGTEIA